jgi:hypothetical protein
MPEPPAPERPELQPKSEAPPSLAAESALPLAQLTVEQTVAWLGTVSGLAPDAIEAAGRSFTANEIDGEDLKTVRPKFLRVILQGCLPEAEVRDAVIAAILGRRDEQLVEESTPEDCMVCPLSLCLMNDPWTTQVGSTCEYFAACSSMCVHLSLHALPTVAPALCAMLAVDLPFHAVNSATDEKENIQRWLRTRHSTQWTDPKTNQKLATNRLTPKEHDSAVARRESALFRLTVEL